jgi:FkbH-like protein
VCQGAAARVLQALTAPRTLAELERELEEDELFADSPGAVVRIVGELRARDLVTESTPEAELDEARERVRSLDGVRGEMRAVFAPVERLSSAPPEIERRAVVLGWCTAEALVPALREEGRARGLALDVRTGFEEDVDLVRRHDADFTVLALGNFRLLAPLYTCGEEDAGQALEHAASECERTIRAAAELTRGTLLVEGLVVPQTEPLGLLGPLSESSVADRIFELNRSIRRVVRTLPNALYVDLERLLAGAGKARLLDDMVAPWAHAGVAGGSDNPAFHRIVARACFDALEAAEGKHGIRCIALDLDGVLWPGEIADPDFLFEDEPRATSLLYGVHGGIHEALRALRARGILLAVVSKNVRESVLEKWRSATSGSLATASHLLAPDDFVALEIGWGDKSQALRDLSVELGIDPAAIAFIDDSPLERAEVRHTLPEVWTLDVPVERVRETLLRSPRCEVLERSAEARTRAQTTRARLQRDRALAAVQDRTLFLASLEVRCTLRRASGSAELDRICELMARTNQFRTTGERLSRRELEATAAAPGTSIMTLSVCDRFADYGLVGVALVERSELRLFTLSCRVIGAEVHQVLFRAALEHCRAASADADVVVRFVETPHNAPALRLFETSAWVRSATGYALPRSAPLPAEPAHCLVLRA